MPADLPPSCHEKEQPPGAAPADLHPLCAGLRAAEGHPAGAAAPAEPRRGEEPAPALDVARFRTRVTARESDRAALDEEVAGLGGRAAADVASVAERRAEAEERAGEAARVGAKGVARDERIAFSQSSLLYKIMESNML